MARIGYFGGRLRSRPDLPVTPAPTPAPSPPPSGTPLNTELSQDPSFDNTSVWSQVRAVVTGGVAQFSGLTNGRITSLSNSQGGQAFSDGTYRFAGTVANFSAGGNLLCALTGFGGTVVSITGNGPFSIDLTGVTGATGTFQISGSAIVFDVTDLSLKRTA
jgi:hypothetical protein